MAPDFPSGLGRDKLKYYESKFGKGNVDVMIPRMKGVAAEHGIEIDYGGTVGNTFDSHRLIWLAREIDKMAHTKKILLLPQIYQVTSPYFWD